MIACMCYNSCMTDPTNGEFFSSGSRPVTRGGSGGSSEPPFLRTPLPQIRTPPQTSQLHISDIEFQACQSLLYLLRHSMYMTDLLGPLPTSLRPPPPLQYSIRRHGAAKRLGTREGVREGRGGDCPHFPQTRTFVTAEPSRPPAKRVTG